jgi:hypothetical protein
VRTPRPLNPTTQQHVLDVGDVSGHQIRVYELHRTYANDKPNCENLKRTESWTRGYSDYIDRNGRTWGYDVTLLENSDKIFFQFDGTSQTGNFGECHSVVVHAHVTTKAKSPLVGGLSSADNWTFCDRCRRAAEFDFLFSADLNSFASRTKTVAKLGRGRVSPVRRKIAASWQCSQSAQKRFIAHDLHVRFNVLETSAAWFASSTSSTRTASFHRSHRFRR